MCFRKPLDSRAECSVGFREAESQSENHGREGSSRSHGPRGAAEGTGRRSRRETAALRGQDERARPAEAAGSVDSGAWTRVLAERPLSGSQHGQSAGRVSAGTRQGPGYLNRGRESSRREQGLGCFQLRCRTTPSWTTLVMLYISRKVAFSRRELFKKHQSFSDSGL